MASWWVGALVGGAPPGRRRSQLGGGPLGERALPSEAA